MVTMQRLWDVVNSLDLVFQANVLASRITSNPGDTSSEHIFQSFNALRSKIDAIAGEIEQDLVNQDVYQSEDWRNYFAKQSGYNKIYCLQRVIDKYLIDQDRSIDGGPLAQRPLESSMMHKRTRNFAVKADNLKIKKDLLETRNTSARYFKHFIRQMAAELV